MRRTLARSLPFGMAILACGMITRAQSEKWKIDAGHSHATFLLISSRAPAEPRVAGVARVSGLANLENDDLSKLALRMSIYPEGEGEALLTDDDTLRPDALAPLAFYSVLSFQSDRSLPNQKNELELSGELALTHVTRAGTAAWSNSYAGSRYVDPVRQTASRDVSFTLVTPRNAIEADEKVGLLKLNFVADISREDFPALWNNLPDSIWPAVVDDKECVMPPYQIDMRDYRGAACTGTVVGPAIVRTDSSSVPELKPEAADHPHRSADKVRIVIELRLKKPQ